MQLFSKFKKILHTGSSEPPQIFENVRVLLAGHIVAMVTSCATKLTATCSPMIGQFVDTMILASTSIEWL